MRPPRHDTSFSLPAEAPGEALSRDESLLDRYGTRWWTAAAPAVVVGLGLHRRIAAVVDLERCAAAGVEVLARRAGGGALLLDAHMLCGAIAVPTAQVSMDVTEAYRWLGELLVRGLARVGVSARTVEVAEARADVAALRATETSLAQTLLQTCYGALSPYEIVVEGRKLVGLAQVRRRDATLFQIGVLLRDQSPLADFLCVADEPAREQLRAELARRTVGLEALTSRSASEVVAAIEDAMPSAL